ncbi:MAG: hypothetical protein IKA17_06530 [Clostridia bacterium]|nr:hypothetical protein [Clostridia bacterium]
MVSPENDYDTFFNCNSSEDANSVIRSLKNEIEQLKNITEHPDYNKSYSTGLYYNTRLAYARESLEKAKQILLKYGKVYVPTSDEIKAIQFQNNVPFINEIELTFKNAFNFNTKHTAILRGNYFELKTDAPISKLLHSADNDGSLVNKQEFLDIISKLYIGEWKNNYELSRFELTDSNVSHWELKISFSNGEDSVKIQGDGVYPYNFSNLEHLFGFDSVGISGETNDDMF